MFNTCMFSCIRSTIRCGGGRCGAHRARGHQDVHRHLPSGRGPPPGRSGLKELADRCRGSPCGSACRRPLVCDARVRKPLSQHLCTCCGLRMQRDLLSAHLARSCDGTAAAADPVRQAWPATEPLRRTLWGAAAISATSGGGNASVAPTARLGRSGSCARPGPWSPPPQHAAARGTRAGRPRRCMAGWIRPRKPPDDREAGPGGTLSGPGRREQMLPFRGGLFPCDLFV